MLMVEFKKNMFVGLAIVLLVSCLGCSNQKNYYTNSVKDFSNLQGQDGWYYGYYDKQTNNFKEFPKYGINHNRVKVWYLGRLVPRRPYTSLWASGGHPQTSPELWAVRRWYSDIAGKVTITGKVSKANYNCGDGIKAYIFVDGEEKWSVQIKYDDADGTKYRVNVEVSVNSIIDFAISPISNESCDGTTFTAKINPLLKVPQK